MSLRPVAGCRVTQVIDGDTVALACPGEDAGRVRLTGFDTPEVFSPQCASEALAGALATQKLRSLVWTGGEIGAIFRGYDRYGRAAGRTQHRRDQRRAEHDRVGSRPALRRRRARRLVRVRERCSTAS